MASPPKKWLLDRIHGQSKYNGRDRPPNPCCWVSPVVGWFPTLCEMNAFCKCFGWLGFFLESEKFRFYCLHVGFLCNIISMLFTAYACLAISTEYFVLSKTSFHTLTASELTTVVGTNEIGSVWKLYMGLRGIAISSSSIGQQQNGIGYNQLCDLTSTASSGGENVEGILLNPYECDSCSDNLMSMNVVISIMISVATFFPTFFS